MTPAPRIIPISDQSGMDTASRAFMALIGQAAEAIYGGDFLSAAGPNGRIMCMLSLAIQGIASPQSFALTMIDLDAVCQGVGIGLGARCASAGLTHDQLACVVQNLLHGFNNGRRDGERAAATLIVQGSA